MHPDGQVADVDLKALFEATPAPCLILAFNFTIVAVSDVYLRATMTEREAILGRGIFDVFPDNPDDPGATGVSNLRASRIRCCAARHRTRWQCRSTSESEGGGFEARYWSPLNSPVLGRHGEVAYIIHRVGT